MRRCILIGVACLLAWSAWPARADEDGTSVKALKARVGKLEAENAALQEALALSLEQSRKISEMQELTTRLLDTAREVAKQQERNAELKRQSLETSLESANLRRQWLELQLKQATGELKTAREDAVAYYGSLFAELGKPAAQALVSRLHQDPSAHAPRVAPVLARMGRKAEAALPVLEKILAGLDAKHWATRAYLEAAVSAIREP